jgi:hypothetical protein
MLRDPNTSRHLPKDRNPAGVLVNRGMMISLERYDRINHNVYTSIFLSSTSVLVRICNYDTVTDVFDMRVLKGELDIRGVTLGDFTRISMRKGTKVVVRVGESTTYAGVISCDRMNGSREWEIQSDGTGPSWVPESEISFPANFDHGSHINKTVNGFDTGGFDNTVDIAICDQLSGVVHKDGVKSCNPPAVWIGGDDVSDYMEEFFEHRSVV